MALRFFNKINSSILPNFETVLQNFHSMSVRCLCQLPKKQDEKKQQPQVQQNQSLLPNLPVYSRTPSDQPLSETELIRNSLQKHHLQPALQPEFYEPPIDLKTGTYPNPVQQDREPEMRYRKFEASKTYQSVTLPLRQPRLASPFPDPVKAMPSDTVSDQEKAEQMQAEARLQKASSKQTQLNATQVRSYATSVGADGGKCPKPKSKGKSKCPITQSKGCPPRKETVFCEPGLSKPCKKKNAPYPAYSEFCHTVLEEKPSECKLCPWKAEDHPSFKPPKKKYHTSSVMGRNNQNGGAKEKVTEKKKAQAFEKWEKSLNEHHVVEELPEKTHESTQQPDTEGLHCMKKKPCERPTNNMCKKKEKKSPSVKEKKKKKNKSGKTNKKKAKGRKQHQAKYVANRLERSKNHKTKQRQVVNDADDRNSWMTLAESVLPIKEFPLLFALKKTPTPPPMPPKRRRRRRRNTKVTTTQSTTSAGKSNKAEKPKGKGKSKKAIAVLAKSKGKDKSKPGCGKFPFSGCKKQPSQPRKREESGCPKPKRRKAVADCPAEKCGDDKKTAMLSELTYILKGDKKDQKCPRVSSEVCKEEEPEDPCNLRRRGVTKKCPSDLLKKKRYRPKAPKKKGAGIVNSASLKAGTDRDCLKETEKSIEK